METKYSNRQEAGKVLAKALVKYTKQPNTVVLALPRGGVPVAYEVAQALHIPLDVFLVRKLGVPGHDELAMGAIAMGGVCVFNDSILKDLQIPKSAIDAEMTKEQQELKRRERSYRGAKPFPLIKDQTVILVDDGIATGATMRAAIKALKILEAKRIVVAVPVADHGLAQTFAKEVDEFICPLQPIHFFAVGAWYEDFRQTEDIEVSTLLQAANM